jgi:hypothetical protein
MRSLRPRQCFFERAKKGHTNDKLKRTLVHSESERERQKIIARDRLTKISNISVANGDYSQSSLWERKLDALATCLDNQDEYLNTRCKYCINIIITDDGIVSVNVASPTTQHPPPTVVTINMKYIGSVKIIQQHYHNVENGVHTLVGNLTCPGCKNLYRSVSYTFSEDKII